MHASPRLERACHLLAQQLTKAGADQLSDELIGGLITSATIACGVLVTFNHCDPEWRSKSLEEHLDHALNHIRSARYATSDNVMIAGVAIEQSGNLHLHHAMARLILLQRLMRHLVIDKGLAIWKQGESKRVRPSLIG